MILSDWFELKRISEALPRSYERARYIVDVDLDMRTNSAKLSYTCSNVDPIRASAEASRSIYDRFERDWNYLIRIFTLLLSVF